MTLTDTPQVVAAAHTQHARWTDPDARQPNDRQKQNFQLMTKRKQLRTASTDCGYFWIAIVTLKLDNNFTLDADRFKT